MTTGSMQDGETCRAGLFESQIAKHFLLLGTGTGGTSRSQGGYRIK